MSYINRILLNNKQEANIKDSSPYRDVYITDEKEMAKMAKCTILMLQLLKFMGDRSHILVAKLLKDVVNVKEPLIYTSEILLQISSIHEGFNTVKPDFQCHNAVTGGAVENEKLHFYIPRIYI